MQGDGSGIKGESSESDNPPGEPGRMADDLVAQFARWSAAERSSAAARSRSLERSMRDQAVASATWAGSLVDLAERRSPVAVCVGAGRLSGTLEAVAPDFCVLVRSGRRPVLVRLDRITSVRLDPTGGHGLPGGSRFPALELSLAAALSLLAEERWPVNLTLAAGDQVAGDLVAVGHDVLTVREQDGPRRSVLVPMAALDYCELR